MSFPFWGKKSKQPSRLIDKAIGEAYGKIRPSLTRPSQLTEYSAIFRGAATAAPVLIELYNPLLEAWGEGDVYRAKKVAEVFTLWMASVWIRGMCEGFKEERPSLVNKFRDRIGASLLSTFDDYNEKAMTEFVNLDTQFNYDRDKGSPNGVSLQILIWRAMRACAPTISVSEANFGSGSRFPITSWEEQMSAGIVSIHPADAMGCLVSLAYAERETLGFLDKLEKALRQEIYGGV